MKRGIAVTTYIVAVAFSVYFVAATLIPLTWSAGIGVAVALVVLALASAIGCGLGVPPREGITTFRGLISR